MNNISQLFWMHIYNIYGINGSYCKWDNFFIDIYNSENDIMSIGKINKLKYTNDTGNFTLLFLMQIKDFK